MVKATHLLGIDLGAGSLKATLIRADGSLAGEASHPVSTSNPKFGWSEQNPDEWYAALCHAVPAALKAVGIAPGAVAGIGFSGGAHIPVLTDAEDRPIRPAIMWSDQRSAAEARELHEKAGETIIRTSLNRVNPTWSLAMLLWLKRHEPEAIKRVDYEPVFFFTKSKEYWFEQQFEPYTAPLNRWGGATLVDKGNGRWDQGTGQNAYRDRAMRPCALGRTKRCIWRIPTKSSGGLHFATFPPVLIETPIKAGCPKQICNHCGKARKPIFSGSSHQAFNIRVRDVQAGRQKHLDRVASEKEVRQYREGSSHVGEGRKFVGYSDCGCGAGWHPGIVLDPFMGSGTTAEVAQRLGRNWIGIELNPEYVRLAKLRLSKVSLPTVRSHVDELHHWPTANGTVGDDNHRQAPDCYRFRSPESEN